jgi:hypothetical protein
VRKYNLTAAVPQIFATTGFGMNDLLNSLTMWVMRSFNVDMCRTILGINAGFLPISGRNQDLYDEILKYLDGDVFLSTTVIGSERTDKSVTLRVRNSLTCDITQVIAKKVLFSAPPTAENLEPLSLDKIELETLRGFSYSRSYVGVVSHPSLPRNVSLVNMPEAAEGQNWGAAIPQSPYNTRFDNYANSPYYRVVVVGDPSLTNDRALQILQETFDRMVNSGAIDQTKPQQKLKILYFQSHGLVNAHATPEVLQMGFIKKLNHLQGRRSTWYTGAAWSVHITTSLWIFTDTLLPKLVQSM